VVTWPTFKFWDPLYISRTAKARKLKFGTHRIDYDVYYSKNAKLMGKGVWPRSRNLVFNSEIPRYFQNGESYKLPKVVSGDVSRFVIVENNDY